MTTLLHPDRWGWRAEVHTPGASYVRHAPDRADAERWIAAMLCEISAVRDE